MEESGMPERLPDANDASCGDYQIDWEGQKAKADSTTRLNFIEAQSQMLSKRRQTKAAKGTIIAIIFSIIIWFSIAKIVF